MTMTRRRRAGIVSAAACTLLLLAMATTAAAQTAGGSIHGTVRDESGSTIPGVVVTLTSEQTAPLTTLTNAQGRFRFLNLSPGDYSAAAELDGYSKIDYPTVVVAVNRNTNLELTMSAATTETITVTTESPLLDERKLTTGATLNSTELQKVPSARDPWTVLQTIPGVLVDRLNVGGSESGQQSGYRGPGSTSSQSNWQIDGVTITDFAAMGSSPAYYDFDAFEEMSFATGGSDAQATTPGLVLNLVTKRGTNSWRGTAKFVYNRDSWQANPAADEGDLGPGQRAFKGNRINSVTDRGVELGGPLWKDHAWLWAAASRQEINKLTSTSTNDPDPAYLLNNTTLVNRSGKLNAQIYEANSLAGTYFYSDKIRKGRQTFFTAGDQDSLDNQSNFGKQPTFWKVEDTQIFGPSFYLTGLYNETNGGFALIPQGGDRVFFLDDDLIQYYGSTFYHSLRPQKQTRLDASSFFTTGNLSHELKFGAGYRLAEVDSRGGFGGGGLLISDCANYGTDPPCRRLLQATRDSAFAYSARYKTLYAQDTLSAGRLTANIGLHYDQQSGSVDPVSIPANRYVPDHLPSISTVGYDTPFEWKSVTPRLGLTYAIDKNRRTLLRGSYSRYANALGGDQINQIATAGDGTYAYFYIDNGTTATRYQPVQASQILAPYPGGLPPPFTPGKSNNRVDPDLKAPTTDELILSLEHGLLPELTLSVNLTYRKSRDPIQTELLVGDGFIPAAGEGRRATQADYVAIPFTTLNGVSWTVYKLRDDIGTNGGTDMFNGKAGTTYKGATFVATKRLSNRWMMRGNFTLSDWRNDIPPDTFANRTETRGGGTLDGDQVLPTSDGGGGAKQAVYMSSRWSYNVNGLYQVAPDRWWGFDVAASLYGRQGWPKAPFQDHSFGREGLRQTTVSHPIPTTRRADDARYENVHLLDLSLQRELVVSRFGLTIGVDCFNVFNKRTVLDREVRIDSPAVGRVRNTVAPRIFRLSARLSFD